MEDQNQFVYVCSHSKYASVVQWGGESPGSVKGNNFVAFNMRCGGRDAILLGSYKPCRCHVPYTHKVFSKVESRSK